MPLVIMPLLPISNASPPVGTPLRSRWPGTSATRDGWMNGVLGHCQGTVKAALGPGQPGLMR